MRVCRNLIIRRECGVARIDASLGFGLKFDLVGKLRTKTGLRGGFGTLRLEEEDISTQIADPNLVGTSLEVEPFLFVDLPSSIGRREYFNANLRRDGENIVSLRSIKTLDRNLFALTGAHVEPVADLRHFENVPGSVGIWLQLDA